MQCPREKCNNQATEHRKYGVLPCDTCLGEDRKTKLRRSAQFATQSQIDRVTEERALNAKDIVQPWTTGNRANEEFAKAYPERAHDYFDSETLRKF